MQLSLQEEINPDSSTAKRSQVTGHLVITMPKVSQNTFVFQTGHKNLILSLCTNTQSWVQRVALSDGVVIHFYLVTFLCSFIGFGVPCLHRRGLIKIVIVVLL